MAPDERNLIRNAQAGDLDAFEELVSRYDRQVLGITARYVRHAEDAKDIFQEVFLRVYRNLPAFRYQSEFSTWLYRITTNVCLSHREMHQQHRLRTVEMDDDEEHHSDRQPRDGAASPEEQTMAVEISERVNDAMEHLSPKQRLVFALKHLEGYKLREIASMMACTEGTVKRYLFAATRRMRTQLQELYEG